MTPLLPVATAYRSYHTGVDNARSASINTIEFRGQDGTKDDLLQERELIDDETPIRIPEINVSVCNNKIKALIDTGSEITCLSEELWFTLSKENPNLPLLPARSTLVSGAFNDKPHSVTKQTYLPVIIDDILHEIPMLIVPQLHRKLIIGSDWLQSVHAEIIFEQKLVCITSSNIKQSIKFESKAMGVGERYCQYITGNTADTDKFCSVIYDSTEDNTDFSRRVESAIGLLPVTQEQKHSMSELLLNHSSVFSERPGRVTNYIHELDITDTTPFFQKSYPIPHAKRQEVDKHIQQMVEWGIIEAAPSSYTNPVVFVVKPKGGIRMCLDARLLNSRLASQHDSPLPMEELLQKFHGKKFFTTLDLTRSFYQLPLKVEHRKYTAFIYNGISYCYCVVPFGIQSSVAGLTRCLNNVFTKEIKDCTTIYIDDLIVASEDFESHMKHVNLVLDALATVEMTINFDKCQFLRFEVDFLGHIISAEGVRVDKAKLQPILDYPRPYNVRQLRRFLGMCTYFKRFTNHYSHTVDPLLGLLKKNVKWGWSSDLQIVFDNVKRLFLDVIMLHHPIPGVQLQVQTDSSDVGIGAQLFQIDNNGDHRVISFSSRSLNTQERRYFTTEKEGLAVIYALQKFRTFLIGEKFTIWTDHKSLSFIKKCRLLNSRMTRWILIIQEYDFDIEYCPAKDNVVADALSRAPVDGGGSNEEEVLRVPTIKHIVDSANGKLKAWARELPDRQRLDPVLRTLIENMEHSPADQLNTDNNKYLCFQNILFHNGGHNKGWRAMVPSSDKHELAIIYHEGYGHMGAYKTFSLISEYFFWKNMRRDIVKITRSCDTCQRAKHSNNTLSGEMGHVIPPKPNALLTTDLYGPLPQGRGGVAYVLVFLDAFTKYVRLYALKRATTVAILHRLVNDYIPTVGRPDRVLADHGTQFTARKWYKTLEEEHIIPLHSSIRHPQSNPTERVMRELGRMFRTYCHHKHTTWVDCLPIIQEWLNVTTSCAHGFSPHELHFGEQPTRVINDLLHLPPPTVPPLGTTQKIVLASERMLTRAARRKTAHDNKKRPTVFSEGDLVLLRSNHLSSAYDKEIAKFFMLYEGPFKIGKVVGHNAYRLIDVRNKDRGVHNVVNLKKYIEPVK